MRLHRKQISKQEKETVKAQLILARGYACTALFINQVVVAEANSTPEIDRLVVRAARQLSVALRVPLVECLVEVPDQMDGIWEWPDLLDKLAAGSGATHEARAPRLLLERGRCTSRHPRWPGRRLGRTVPRHAVAGRRISSWRRFTSLGFGVLDKAVHAKVLEDFEAWLSNRRTQNVSAIFHETVAKAASLISLRPAQQDTQTLVEQVTMSVLGQRVDPSPGINWQCARQWRVKDVRAAVRGALEAARVIPLADCSAQADAPQRGTSDTSGGPEAQLTTRFW